MKKIYNVFAIVLASAALVACDDFLTKAPETKVTSATFFKSATELELWTNKFYNDILPSPEDVVEIYADDLTGTGTSAVQKGTRTASSSSWSANTFKPLRNINYFLENSVNCADEAALAQHQGVAYFFRAYFYYEKVRQYGDMPYYDKVIGSSDEDLLFKARDPRGYVMMKVLEDCDKAYELLPDKWSAGAVYHVSKDAAMALKARAALYEGTFRKYHAGTEFVPEDKQTFDGVEISSEWFLKQAAAAAETIIGKRSLYKGNSLGLATKDTDASYREYFILEAAETAETILSRCYNVDILVRHGLQFDMKNGKRSATQRFVNHYLQSDGKPIQDKTGWDKMEYYDQFQKRDPRMAQTLHGPKYVALDETAHEALNFERTVNGYRIIKFISNTDHENATTSTTDYPLFRYAEVLLNYAEAKAELGTLTNDDVVKTIDVIRARVGMPAMATVPSTVDPLMKEYYPNAKGDQLAAILEIRRERTVELAFEGFRQWDLLRWKEGKWMVPAATKGFQGIYVPALGEYDLDKDGKIDVCFYKGSKPSTSAPTSNIIEIGSNYTLTNGDSGFLTYFATEDYVWNEAQDYLWPIPEDQRQLNTNLTQNPGWKDGVK